MNRIKKVIIAVSGLMLTLPAAAMAEWGCSNGAYGPGWHHMYGGGFYNGGIFMMIFSILLIILAVFFGLKFFKQGTISGLNNETPLDILKRRLAKGEITRDEFEELKKVL